MSSKLILVAVSLTLAGSLAAVDAGEKAAPSKSGQITLEAATKVCDITLKPGVYRVEYQTQGYIDLMHFTPVNNPREEWTVLVDADLDPSRRPAKRTRVTLKKEGNAVRMEKIVLKGGKTEYHFD